MNQAPDDKPDVLVFPPLGFVLCLGIGIGLHWLWPSRLPAAIALKLAGGALIVGAALLALAARRAFKLAGTHIRPDRPATAIVSSGPYRFTRNPMYLALCLLHAGIALVSGWSSILCTLPLLAITFHHGVIVREEKYLAAKFGAAYRSYQSSVRRWF